MSDEWTAELKVLQDLIEHHVGEEESTGFSCARDEFTKEQLEGMSEQFHARKAQLTTRITGPRPLRKIISGRHPENP